MNIDPDGTFAADLDSTLRLLGAEIGIINIANGWDTSRAMTSHPDEYPANWQVTHQIAELGLIATEVSEAIEEVRHGEPMNGSYYHDLNGVKHGALAQGLVPSGFKPEGVPSELADILIRVLDIADAYSINLAAALVEKLNHNATRGLHHGGKTL